MIIFFLGSNHSKKSTFDYEKGVTRPKLYILCAYPVQRLRTTTGIENRQDTTLHTPLHTSLGQLTGTPGACRTE